jgi:S-adenosylmethionine:tRNA ribosyltransferase-isomerase
MPDSSLILLVSSFAGKELIKSAYQEALKNKYMFLSYGDSMLIL